jgi:hypothetical protein
VQPESGGRRVRQHVAEGGEQIVRGLLQRAWAVVGRFRRAYVALNVVYYGLVVCGMVYVAFNPSLQQSLLEAVGGEFSGEGLLSAVGEAYAGGQILTAIVLTFVVNLVVGSGLSVTLPSLVIPFSGLLMGAYRALMWGLMLSPTTAELRTIMIPHSLTLILEGQAYILAMLAAYVQGRAFLWPRTVDAPTRRQGYVQGVRFSARLYLLVILLLAVAAVYEAVEATLLVSWLG